MCRVDSTVAQTLCRTVGASELPCPVRNSNACMRLPLDNRGKERDYLGLCASLPLVVCGLFTYAASSSCNVEWHDDW
jgi:hypothetical protein